MKKESGEKQEKFFDKQQQEIYNIITGKVRYHPQPFRQEDTHPDLVIKMKIPQNEKISRGSYLSLSSFSSIPSQKLERAYTRAEKKIAKEMQINRQNIDPLNLQIRLQMAIKKIGMATKQSKIINQNQEQDIIQLQCVHEKIDILDSFTLMYNTFVYTLQNICGFRVKAFILYNKQVTERHIYLFLSLSTNNLLRIASKYRIKKELQYTHLDFFLNDPKTDDLRPVKLHSKFITDKQNATHLKHIRRYFKVKEKSETAQDINRETSLNDEELDNFRSCSEELHILYEYLKYKRDFKLTSNEKMYLFDHNRRKLNPGVQEYYIVLKKRKEYFSICKEILPKYGYQTFQEPVIFQQFSLPDKKSRGANFFNKLQNILLYKPVITTVDGKMQLFLNMEKTKLCYMAIKKNFKVNFLSLLGIEIFPLQNEFDKNGIGGDDDIKGGLDGQNLVDNWNPYSLFSDYKVIRNYMGQRVAYQTLYNGYAIGYLMSILVPFIVLFTIQQVFKNATLYTNQIQAFLFATSYAIYMSAWQSEENQFNKNYCDSIKSQIFLNKFRGPYTRNLVNDQANQFRRPQGTSAYWRNLACFLLIVALSVILGAIFHGFRMMLVEIYDPLKAYKFKQSFSLPHIIVYALFFSFEQGFRLIVNQIINFMIYLQNPPSDEAERQQKDSLTFFYLLAIEMIPPFFLLILQPFTGTSCYANQCKDQLTLYIYSRYVFIIGSVAVKFIWILFFNYIRKYLKKMMKQKKKAIFYQDKLSELLKNAIEDSKKPQHQEDKMNILTNLQNYAIYCTILPISPAIVFLAVFIHFVSLRLTLLGGERRPLNRSQSIIRVSYQLKYIYYLGILINSWISIFLFQTVQWYFPDVIQLFNNQITEQSIFLLKIFICIFYCAITLLFGWIASAIALSFSQDVLNARKDNKFKEYRHSRGGLKITLKKGIDMTPIKTVFRIFNPDQTSQELIQKFTISEQKLDNSQRMESAVNLEGQS